MLLLVQVSFSDWQSCRVQLRQGEDSSWEVAVENE